MMTVKRLMRLFMFIKGQIESADHIKNIKWGNKFSIV